MWGRPLQARSMISESNYPEQHETETFSQRILTKKNQIKMNVSIPSRSRAPTRGRMRSERRQVEQVGELSVCIIRSKIQIISLPRSSDSADRLSAIRRRCRSSPCAACPGKNTVVIYNNRNLKTLSEGDLQCRNLVN